MICVFELTWQVIKFYVGDLSDPSARFGGVSALYCAAKGKVDDTEMVERRSFVYYSQTGTEKLSSRKRIE